MMTSLGVAVKIQIQAKCLKAKKDKGAKDFCLNW